MRHFKYFCEILQKFQVVSFLVPLEDGVRFALTMKVRHQPTCAIKKKTKCFFALSAAPTTPAHTAQWGDANSQLAKEGGSFEECDAAKPRKNVMQLTQEENTEERGSFEECYATQPRKNVMQLTQVLNAQNKVHIERESVLQLNC